MPAAPSTASPTDPSTPAPPPRWRRLVVVGDSFSEGLWDPYPGDPDRQRGWADRLADHLSARRTAAGEAPLEYAKLAIRGRLLRPILTEQVPRALALEPDLVSLIGGGNDILRPAADIGRLTRNLEHAVARIRATGADVLLGTGFDASGPVLGLTRSRVGVYNATLWSIARRHGCHVLDLWGMRSLQDARLWSSDRIHLTPEGHRRVADAALVGLGLAPDDGDWDEPLEEAPPTPRVARARENAEWVRIHLVPWAQRRLHGTSSGDEREPTWPEPVAWPPAGLVTGDDHEPHERVAPPAPRSDDDGPTREDRVGP